MTLPDSLRAYAYFERRAGVKLTAIAADCGVSFATVCNWCIAARVEPAKRQSDVSYFRRRRLADSTYRRPKKAGA